MDQEVESLEMCQKSRWVRNSFFFCVFLKPYGLLLLPQIMLFDIFFM